MKTLKDLGLSDVAKRVRLSSAWNEAVGAEMASRTEPLTLSRGVLTIRSTSAAWQNELTFLKGEILRRINAALGKENAVRELRVVAGTLRSAPKPVERPRWLDEAPTVEDREIAEDAALPLHDPELKAAFEKIVMLHRRASRGRNLK